MESEQKLSLKDFVYISTLSDLGITYAEHGSSMLKLDIVPGDYGLLEFHDGYVMAKYGYYPDFRDVTKIFNSRDGDKGLSGTYWGSATKNQNHMRLYNDFFRFHLHEDYLKILYDNNYDLEDDDEEIWFEESDSDSEGHDSGMEKDIIMSSEDILREKKLNQLPDCHNLPVLFYLNQTLNEDDLYQVSLKYPMDKKVGNVQQVWRVVHEFYGDIGVAVLQKELYNLMGDQAGLAFFATTTGQAFGNVNAQKLYKQKVFANKWVDYPRYQFICKFNPCNCDWRYNVVKKN